MNKRNLRREGIFNDLESKKLFQKGMKYLAVSLPLLFFSPILVTMGFKAIRKDSSYWMIILGCFLTALTIALVTQAFRLILKSLFAR